jgi:hypothetical protein
VRFRHFPVLGQPTTPGEPGDGSFDDPAFGQHDELADIAALNDLDVGLPADPAQGLLKLRPLIAVVGVELQQEREQAEQRAHQQHATVAILHIGSMGNGAQQQTFGIYQEVALLALDLLPRVIATGINRAPPFSALFTL